LVSPRCRLLRVYRRSRIPICKSRTFSRSGSRIFSKQLFRCTGPLTGIAGKGPSSIPERRTLARTSILALPQAPGPIFEQNKTKQIFETTAAESAAGEDFDNRSRQSTPIAHAFVDRSALTSASISTHRTSQPCHSEHHLTNNLNPGPRPVCRSPATVSVGYSFCVPEWRDLPTDRLRIVAPSDTKSGQSNKGREAGKVTEEVDII